MWCCAELGLEVKRIDAGIHYGVNNTQEYLSLNPNGTIPLIKDGDNPPLWESGAINRYLARTYGNETYWPTDPVSRATVDQWTEWSKINIAMNFTVPVFWAVVRTPLAHQNKDAINKAVDTLTRNLRIAEQQIAGRDYLVGDTFTTADIMFGHLLYRYFMIDIERTELPNIARYYNQLTKRPAYQQHVMVNFDELRAMNDPSQWTE